MRKLSLILSILFLLSCSSIDEMENDSNYYELKIEFENVDGLETGAKVIYKGKNVGKVKDLKIAKNNNIEVLIELPNEFKIPLESDFTIFSSDLLGSRAIDIEFSQNEKDYNANEIIKGKNQMSLSDKVDLVINQVKNGDFKNSIFEIIEDTDSFIVVKYFKTKN